MARTLDPSRTLAARFPRLAAQWHPDRNPPGPDCYTPDTIPANSPVTVWWRCAEGHEWQDKVATRTAMPKWKNGNIAACPECLRSPTRLVVHTYPDCGHTRTVQRKNAEKDQQNCWDCSGDPDPAKDAARLERKRASALASYHRCKQRGGPLTEDERTAQRALVGFLNRARVELTAHGLTWWRESITPEGSFLTTTRELSDWLSTLSIPHSIAIRRLRSHYRIATETGVYLHFDDLDELRRWTPKYVTRVHASLKVVAGSGPPRGNKTKKWRNYESRRRIT